MKKTLALAAANFVFCYYYDGAQHLYLNKTIEDIIIYI